MTNKRKDVAGRRERRAFSAEFKAEAVRMAAERRAAGVPLTQVRAWTRAGRRIQPVGATVA